MEMEKKIAMEEEEKTTEKKTAMEEEEKMKEEKAAMEEEEEEEEDKEEDKEEETTEKKTAGRQNVPLAKIERKDHRYATFSKRRSDLYKKTSKLVRESGADIGIIFSSPSDRFENPNIELDYTTQVVAAYLHNKVNQSCDRLKEFKTREKIASQHMLLFDQLKETRQIDQRESIDQLNADDITKYEAMLNGIVFGLDNHLKQLENGASSSSQALPENADNSSISS